MPFFLFSFSFLFPSFFFVSFFPFRRVYLIIFLSKIITITIIIIIITTVFRIFFLISHVKRVSRVVLALLANIWLCSFYIRFTTLVAVKGSSLQDVDASLQTHHCKQCCIFIGIHRQRKRSKRYSEPRKKTFVNDWSSQPAKLWCMCLSTTEYVPERKASNWSIMLQQVYSIESYHYTALISNRNSRKRCRGDEERSILWLSFGFGMTKENRRHFSLFFSMLKMFFSIPQRNFSSRQKNQSSDFLHYSTIYLA